MFRETSRLVSALVLTAILALCANAQLTTTMSGGHGGAAAPSITFTNIGAAAGSNVVTLAASVSSGSLLVMCVLDTSTTGVGAGESVADSKNAGNWTAGPGNALNNANANGFTELFYKFNSAAMTSGVDTITYTKAGAGSPGVSALVATGILSASDPGEASAHAGGNSATPSVTSGSPTTTGEAFIGCAGKTGIGVFTQDSVNAAWAAPPNTFTQFIGGSVVNAGSGTLIYAPTVVGAHLWADVIIAFKHK